jgi:mRNA interferase RelE/StbE
MYHVIFTPDANSDLAHLDKPVAQRILKKIRWLAENFDLIALEPLTGDWQDVFKLRVDDYRVLYTFSKAETTIFVYFVKHRREVYKINN